MWCFKMKKILLILISCLLFSYAKEPIVVAVPATLNIPQLSKYQVKRIFLSKTNRIENYKIHYAHISNNKYQKYFFKKITGKSPSKLRAYWSTLIFTGKGHPPKGYTNLDELNSAINNGKRVIFYLPKSKVTKNMKIVYTLK